MRQMRIILSKWHFNTLGARVLQYFIFPVPVKNNSKSAICWDLLAKMLFRKNLTFRGLSYVSCQNIKYQA